MFVRSAPATRHAAEWDHAASSEPENVGRRDVVHRLLRASCRDAPERGRGMVGARERARRLQDDGWAEIRRTLDRVRGVLVAARARCALARGWLERVEGRLHARAKSVHSHPDARQDSSESVDAACDTTASGCIGRAPGEPIPATIAAVIADVWQALEVAARAPESSATTDGTSADAFEQALETCLARALQAMGDADQRDLVAGLRRLARALGDRPARDGPRRDRFRPALRP